MRFFDGGAHLLDSELRRAWLFSFRVDSSSRHEFDQVNASSEHGSYTFACLVGTIDLET